MDNEPHVITLESINVQIDLREVLPLRLKDWRVLRTKGVMVEKLANIDMETVLELAVYLVTHEKAKPQLGAEAAEQMTLTEAMDIAVLIGSSERGKADRPTLSSSSLSPSDSDGGLPISND